MASWWMIVLLTSSVCFSSSSSLSTSSLPDLYRSLVMEHFSHKSKDNDKLDNAVDDDFFNYPGLSLFQNNFKRGVEVIDNDISNDITVDVPKPSSGSRISPFVNLGGFQSKPQIFFEGSQFQGSAFQPTGQVSVSSFPVPQPSKVSPKPSFQAQAASSPIGSFSAPVPSSAPSFSAPLLSSAPSFSTPVLSSAPSLSAPVVSPAPSFPSVPFPPAPPSDFIVPNSQPVSTPFQHPIQDRKDFAVKPFTFFNLPSTLSSSSSSPSTISSPSSNPAPVAQHFSQHGQLPSPVQIASEPLLPQVSPVSPISPVSAPAGPVVSAPVRPDFDLSLSVSGGAAPVFSFPSRDSGSDDNNRNILTIAATPQPRHPVADPFLAVPANSFVEPVINNLVEDDEDKPFNIFEYIGRPTAEREVRRKVNGEMKKMGKVDALRILMTIAGDTWEQDLVMGSKDDGSASGGHAGSNFDCPLPNGHFPDPDTCSVYYQCAGGVSHKYTCQTGLMYNSLTNQCDWEQSVDCSARVP